MAQFPNLLGSPGNIVPQEAAQDNPRERVNDLLTARALELMKFRLSNTTEAAIALGSLGSRISHIGRTGSKRDLEETGEEIPDEPSENLKKNKHSQTRELTKGQADAYEKLLLPNGDINWGETQNEIFSGQGMLVYINGAIYRGNFRNGKPAGQGRLHFYLPNGFFACYIGEFKEGFPHGEGKLNSDKGQYEGRFCNPFLYSNN